MTTENAPRSSITSPSAPAPRTASPTQAEFEKGPSQRFADIQRERDTANKSGPEWVHTRDAEGKYEIKPRAASSNTAPPENRNPLDPVQMLAGDGAQKLKIGELEISEAEVRSALEAKAIEDSRKLALPKSREEYQAVLPADFKMPGNLEFKINEQDPFQKGAVDAARDFALKKGYTQGEFSELLGLYGASQAKTQLQLNEASAREREKLGAAGVARVTAVNTWLDAHFDKDVAFMFKSTMVSDAQVRGFEKIMQRLSNQGSGSYSGSHREADTGPHMSDEQWDRMSYAEKKDYGQRFKQPGQ